MKKVTVKQKTKFWILYQELYGDGEHKDDFDKRVESIVNKLPILSCKTTIVDRKMWGYNQYLSFKTDNDYEIALGNSIRVRKHINNGLYNCGYDFVITDKVVIDNLVHLIQCKEIIPSEDNRKVINAYLRGKKDWNYLVLKSVRE
jgi:hypothetical protein